LRLAQATVQAKSECEKLEKTWNTLSDAVAELKKRGMAVPSDIYVALRGVRSLIDLCKGHPKLEELVPADIDAHEGFCVACCGADVVARIKCEMRNIEDLLILKTFKEFGANYASRLQQKMMNAWTN